MAGEAGGETDHSPLLALIPLQQGEVSDPQDGVGTLEGGGEDFQESSENSNQPMATQQPDLIHKPEGSCQEVSQPVQNLPDLGQRACSKEKKISWICSCPLQKLCSLSWRQAGSQGS